MNVYELARLAPKEIGAQLDKIGNTPLIPIECVIDGVPRIIHLKLEGFNPAGSVKDRTAISLIRDLERRHRITDDNVIVESSSGNLGVALAMICKSRGYKLLAVVDPKTTSENIRKMEAFGARIEKVAKPDPSGGYLLARLDRVRQICATSAHYLWTDQYSNVANPDAHYSETAPEIYQQMRGEVDVVFVAVSTGGTLAGVGRYFREINPRTVIVGVDACGSIVFGGSPAPRKLTGIGSARVSSFIEPILYDTSIIVTDEQAFAFCRAINDATGISVGGSSGAVLAACASYLLHHPEKFNVVCLCPDDGNNYQSTIYNDQWLVDNNIALMKNSLEPVTEFLVPTLLPYEDEQYSL